MRASGAPASVKWSWAQRLAPRRSAPGAKVLSSRRSSARVFRPWSQPRHRASLEKRSREAGFASETDSENRYGENRDRRLGRDGARDPGRGVVGRPTGEKRASAVAGSDRGIGRQRGVRSRCGDTRHRGGGRASSPRVSRSRDRRRHSRRRSTRGPARIVVAVEPGSGRAMPCAVDGRAGVVPRRASRVDGTRPHRGRPGRDEGESTRDRRRSRRDRGIAPGPGLRGARSFRPRRAARGRTCLVASFRRAGGPPTRPLLDRSSETPSRVAAGGVARRGSRASPDARGPAPGRPGASRQGPTPGITDGAPAHHRKSRPPARRPFPPRVGEHCPRPPSGRSGGRCHDCGNRIARRFARAVTLSEGRRRTRRPECVAPCPAPGADPRRSS